MHVLLFSFIVQPLKLESVDRSALVEHWWIKHMTGGQSINSVFNLVYVFSSYVSEKSVHVSPRRSPGTKIFSVLTCVVQEQTENALCHQTPDRGTSEQLQNLQGETNLINTFQNVCACCNNFSRFKLDVTSVSLHIIHVIYRSLLFSRLYGLQRDPPSDTSPFKSTRDLSTKCSAWKHCCGFCTKTLEDADLFCLTQTAGASG